MKEYRIQRKEDNHWITSRDVCFVDAGVWINDDLEAGYIKLIELNRDLIKLKKKFISKVYDEIKEDNRYKSIREKSIKENCRKLDGVCLSRLRVKPERHKFKTGDWVIHNGVVKRVTKAVDGYIDSLDNEVAVIMKEESLELWEPEDEKYFWYKNDLVRFHETQANLGLLLESARGCSYYPAEKNFEDYCEPFIGKLPSNLKQDSKNMSVK